MYFVFVIVFVFVFPFCVPIFYWKTFSFMSALFILKLNKQLLYFSLLQDFKMEHNIQFNHLTIKHLKKKNMKVVQRLGSVVALVMFSLSFKDVPAPRN